MKTKCRATGKQRYPSKLEADLALADIQRGNAHHRRRKYRDEPVRSYPCDACGGWHLTHLTLDEYESRRTISH